MDDHDQSRKWAEKALGTNTLAQGESDVPISLHYKTFLRHLLYYWGPILTISWSQINLSHLYCRWHKLGRVYKCFLPFVHWKLKPVGLKPRGKISQWRLRNFFFFFLLYVSIILAWMHNKPAHGSTVQWCVCSENIKIIFQIHSWWFNNPTLQVSLRSGLRVAATLCE